VGAMHCGKWNGGYKYGWVMAKLKIGEILFFLGLIKISVGLNF
jgi:hypothetical protein